MRRSVLLTVMTVSVVALSACGRKDNNQVTTEQTTTVETTTPEETTTQAPSKDVAESDLEGAVKILDDIWASYDENDKFPCIRR